MELNSTFDHSRSTSTPRLDFLINHLDKVEHFIKYISYIGIAALFIMICLTFTDVVLRYIFNRPINASSEITELLMAIVVYTGLAFAQVTKSHITMDIVSSRLSERNRLLLSIFSYALSLAFLFFIIQRSASYALFEVTRYRTTILELPIRPFALLVPCGFVLFFLAMLNDILKDIRNTLSYGWGTVLFILGFSLIIIISLCLFIAYRPISLSPVAWGIIGIVGMLLLFATTIPVPLILSGISFIFICLLRGTHPGMILLGKSWWVNAASYSWSPMMFFLFMGYMCFYSGLGEDIFDTASKWMGHWPGGLAIGSVGACTAFGAVVGDNLSGSIAMTTIGLPAMKKQGYDDRLSIGTLTCSGTLGTLIPPSIAFILYAMLSEQSIGDLFMAGVIPGIICALCFIGMILVRVKINPSLASPMPRSDWKTRFISLKTGGPIAILFFIVIFGIYGGVFTATEGGGIGAFGAMIISLIMGRITIERLNKAFSEAIRFIAMIFVGLAGASLLNTFMALSKFPIFLANMANSLSIPPMAVLVLIVFILLLIGCFLPAIPMILICVPIFLPIAKTYGWDLIWFGVLIVLIFNTSNITPPFGINLFIIKEVAHTKMELMYKSALPFVIALFICIALIILFPALSTWLPSLV
ncbi:TRAP transporter large permease subunit [Deltaproteobacteria bacterium]|nr:TRAP transporter large permease subunit [Deltaproteobacteria bacterium]